MLQWTGPRSFLPLISCYRPYFLCPHKIKYSAVDTGVAYSDSETEIFLARPKV